MSESDPRFHKKIEKGTEIVVKHDDELGVYTDVTDDYEQSNWTGNPSTEDKIGRAIELMETQPEGIVLPTGMTIADIKQWVPKAATTLNKNKGKFYERKLGRTGLEVWAFPSNYAMLEASMGGGGGKESLEDVDDRRINVAELVYDEVSIHGRPTIDELVRNIGAIDPQLITVVVNNMLADNFLVIYTEEDGLKTLELVEAHTRNKSLGYTKDEEDPKQLIDKDHPPEEVKNIEDIIPIIDPMDD